MALPLEIQQSFSSQSSSSEPSASARALNSIEGGLGETYALVDDQSLYLYSRCVGGDQQEIIHTFSELDHLAVLEDRPFAYLIVGSGADEKRLKFSSFDMETLSKMVSLWRPEEEQPSAVAELPVAKAEPEPASPEIPGNSLEGDPSPLVLFCATAYALIQSDGSIATEELEMLNQQVGDPETVALGLQWLRRLGTVDLIDTLKRTYSHQQKLCLMANLLEISMVDGLLRSTEKKLMKQVQEALEVDQEDFQAIFDVILIKNNLTVFQASE